MSEPNPITAEAVKVMFSRHTFTPTRVTLKDFVRHRETCRLMPTEVTIEGTFEPDPEGEKRLRQLWEDAQPRLTDSPGSN